MSNGDTTVQILVNGTTVTGKAFDFTATKTHASIAEAYSGVFAVRSAGVDTVFKVDTASGAGQLTDPVKGIAIKNLDATNFVTVGLIDASAKAFYTKINAGEAIYLADNEMDANADGGVVGTFTSLDTITAQFNTAPGKIEIIAFK